MDQEWLDKTAAAMRKRIEVKVSGCSIWKGYVRKCRGRRGGGYGIMNVQFPDSNSRTMMRVHRLAYIVHTGSLIPRQYDVSHLCHNSLCVNFHHLSLEPHSINNSRKTCNRNKKCMGHGSEYKCRTLLIFGLRQNKTVKIME